MYCDNGQARAVISTLLFMVPLIVVMAICVNAYLVPKQKEDAARRNEQRLTEQQADEIIKYMQWLEKNGDTSPEEESNYRDEPVHETKERPEELRRR